MARRSFFAAIGAMGAAALASCGKKPDNRPVALVYRGPASTKGCPEAVAKLLESAPTPYRTVYCGPDEKVKLSAETLRTAQVYAQPGGGDLDDAWPAMRKYAKDIQAWVHDGGHYLGFCLGAYLAGKSPGFDLLPGDTDQYIDSKKSTVKNDKDTVVRVSWRGRSRHMYFQDGPIFKLKSKAAVTVLATYDNGQPAAVVTGYGRGRVGVVGPHPEADDSWYGPHRLTNPDGIQFDLGHDFVMATVRPG